MLVLVPVEEGSGRKEVSSALAVCCGRRSPLQCPCAHRRTFLSFFYLSIPKCYYVRIGKFTVFLEARDKKQNKGPRAMHLNRRDLDYHPNLRHQTFVFAIMPNVLIFHHRDSRMTPVYAISDISRWREYYASGVGCFRTFSSRRWYSDQFRCKNTRISFRYDETRTKNVKL